MLGDPRKNCLGLQMHAQWYLSGGRRQMHRAYVPLACWVILATGPQAAFMTGAEFLGPARHQVRASVTLTHPCQHAAAHLPCTRPPDACGSSLDRPRNRLDQGSSSPRLHPATGLRHFSPLFYCSFCDSAQFFQASRTSFLLVHHVGRPAGRPRTPGRIHSEDHIISHRFSPPSTGCISGGHTSLSLYW